MGDFNINALDSSSSAIRFVDLLKTFGLRLLINTPTRVTSISQSAIDNVISNLSRVAVRVVNTAISDHYGQEAIISGDKILREPIITKTIRDTRPSNIARLKYSLFKETWECINSTQLIERNFKAFSDCLNFHLNTCCPIKTIKSLPKNTNNKWITKGILVSREKLKFFSEIYKTSTNENFKTFYRKYRNTYRRVIQAAKAIDVSNSITTSNNIAKTVWNIINNKQTYRKQLKIKIGERLVDDSTDVANEFNRFFASAACEQGQEIGLPRPQESPFYKRSPATSMVLAPVVEEELEKIIQQLPAKKSNDINLMSAWLIKQIANQITKPLTQLVNSSFEQGVFPSLLKIAKVCPIFKKNDPNSINNYRPVSILPIISKIFEKLFLIRMVKFLNKHNLLSDDQFGFRKGKSTIDAVVSLIEKVVEGLEGRRYVLGIFLDLSKAFDCVVHAMLLDQLFSYGIRGVPLEWIRSFLNNRPQVVQILNKFSEPTELRYGVPQGSILSPILFLIYVNNVMSSLLHGNLIQYADDTTLLFSDKSKLSLEQKTFIDLNNCVQYFSSLNLRVNPSKCSVLNFSLRPQDATEKPAVLLGDSLLEETASSIFLGIHLDRGLTWNAHMDHVCSKLSSGIFVLRSLARFCPTQVLRTAYYGLIYPHLTYGVVLWGASSDNQFSRAFKLQKTAIRIIAQLKFRESCKEAFKKLQLLTLPCIYILETTIFCVSKRAMISGRDIHAYQTRGRDNYRTEKHRTGAHERLPSHTGVRFVNKLPDPMKNAKTPQALKARLKRFLASQAFYSADEFIAYNWETT